MERKRYENREQLLELATILAGDEDWRIIIIFYELELYLIESGKEWVTETQAREWLERTY